MTVADAILDAVASLGVRHVFVLPGGGAMHLVDALARSGTLTPVPLLHEQAVGIAAEAYGQFTGVPGVALVTTGPGATNALTATAAAWLDSTPCLFISGQVKTADLVGHRGVRQFGFQEIDIISMVRPLTKAAVQLVDPARVHEVLDDLLRLASRDRPGPVWLDVPLDIQAAAAPRKPSALPPAPLLLQPDPGAVLATAAALRAARRPLLLLGNGVRLAGGEGLALQLVERLGLPVATTWKALDLVPADHPLFAGRPGAIASRHANFAQQGSDVLVCVGARLDLGQTGYRHDTFGNSALKVVVDVDEHELAKLAMRPMLPVHADAAAFLRELDAALPAGSTPDWTPWQARIAEWAARFPLVDPDERDWSDGLSLYTIVDEVSEALQPSDLFVPGSSGACSEVSMQAFRNKAGQRVLNTEGLGAMGFGVPAAIGACLASGGRRTVCIDGDGGFAMNVQELASAARLHLPITWIVLDNDGYGSIRSTADTYFDGRRVGCDEASGLRIPDYTQVAPALGVPTVQVTTLAEFQSGLRLALEASGPRVIVAAISPRQRTRPRVTSRRLPGGGMETTPLEHLHPEVPGLDVAAELARELPEAQ